MPREVVLTLPPSEEAPATDGPALTAAVAAALAVTPESLGAVRLRRLSFDARRRERRWRLVVDVWLQGETVPPAPPTTPPTLARPPATAPHVVIVGSGPAGLFCALDALAAGLRVTVLERGRDVQARRHALAALNRGQAVDPDSNYCFGEGGAGTYSDGKLYTRSGRKETIRAVLETLVAHGAPPEILASWRPHVGSNRLPRVVEALRETIRRADGEVRFGARVEEIVTDGGVVCGVRVRDLDRDVVETIAADAVVLATGHSARDAIAMAARAGARLDAKGFSMGVRIEHPQPWLDQRQYGGLRGACDLPAAFYELTSQIDGRGVYSFCMCPGGFVVPASTDPSRVVVNGMSLSRRDSPYANSGLVVQLEPSDWCGETGAAWGWGDVAGPLPTTPDDDPLFGVHLQEALEARAAVAGGGGNRVPAQRADAFLSSTAAPDALPTSYRPGVTTTALADVLPPGMTSRLRSALREFDRRMPGYAGPEAQMLGVETRTSSPVRIARDPETLAGVGLAGLYPCGEGAGYAGGIVSAAIDGRRVAAALAASLLAPHGTARH
ncbi:MAG TPA: FAD-dependent oxidoreductase [Candidatus Binatia bacterium]|nr:FAD-dependent oxidoreductase [Candidatus Binatia bacterium]